MAVIPSVLVPFFHPPDFGNNPAVDALKKRAEFLKSADVDALKYEQLFNEKEPNNTIEQGNDLGQLSPSKLFHISGHLDGNSDPYDYFNYTVSHPGNIDVIMIDDNNEVIYHGTFTAQQQNEAFYYYGWAEGNDNFSYDTFISLTLIA
jgi:hypothetical protein